MIAPDPKTETKSRYPGIELLRYWRQSQTSLPKIIILTVVTNPDVTTELNNLGVAEIIHKPVLPSELRARVRATLGLETDEV
jgi:DNA-binding response OmpR family regulator